MSPRARVTVVVAVVAAAAAGTAVGAALLQAPPAERDARPQPARPTGSPPLLLDLGVRDDEEAEELRRANRLYEEGERARAGEIFARYDGVNAQVGAAVAAWPDGAVARLEELRSAHPRNALVRVNLGLALFWGGRREAAIEEWRAAVRVEPDSPAAVRAGDLLHPNSPRGLPTFVPASTVPPELSGLAPREQLAALERAAETGGPDERILYGVALQRLGRPVSAQRQFDRVVAAHPENLEARVAAAVARFRKGEPAEAFGRLGPLASEHPRSPTVRFHLGLLLLWVGEVEDAKRQLRLARDAGPQTPLGREASRFLERLEEVSGG